MTMREEKILQTAVGIQKKKLMGTGNFEII